jgi:hypothetical protein
VRTLPEQMDSLTFYSWSAPLVRAVIPCRDAPLDWELFCHRYLAYEASFPPHMVGRSKKYDPLDPVEWAPRDPDRGRDWLKTIIEGDSTYLYFLYVLDGRRMKDKIGEALDSLMLSGRKHSFRMQEFLDVIYRIVPDSSIRKLARSSLRSSPYGRKPAYDLGLKKLNELFLNRKVVVPELNLQSRAYLAGLRKGDEIVGVEGLPVVRHRSRAYSAWLAKKKGQTLTLDILRGTGRKVIAVPVG